MKNKIKHVLKILIIVLLDTVFIFGTLELFLRINPKFGYIYNSFRLVSEETAMSRRFEALFYRPSSLLGYEHIPNQGNYNCYGLVGKDYKLKKEKNTFRILLLGDSIAEQDWSRKFLEEYLNNNSLLNTNYKFEIWNAGVGGYDVRQCSIYLKHKGLDYQPDMIIIFLFMNDFEPNINIYYKTNNGVTEYYFPVREISKIYTPNRFFMKHSYLYRFIILKFDSFLASKKKNRDIDQKELNGRYYLKIINQICQEKNIPLFILIFPYLKPLTEYDDLQLSEYSIICKVVEELKIHHLNLYNLYEQLLKKNYPMRYSEEDDIHPSKEVHRLIAKEVFNYLLDNFFSKS